MTKASRYYLLASALVTIFQFYVSDAQLSAVSLPPEDAALNFTGLAIKYKQRPMQYQVITEDGYILTVFRLLGKRRSHNASRTPLLLMHGGLDSSDGWLLRGKDSLGVALEKDGYDVWFGNSRGNKYSRSHVYLDADRDPAYWDFSLHELGYFDLPVIIDKVLNETGAMSLTAIGFSQGNLIFYILGSTRTEYNSKINLMIALSPLCYLHNIQPPASFLWKIVPVLDNVFDIFSYRITEVLGFNSTAVEFLRAVSTIPIIGPDLFLNFLFFPLLGFDPIEFEPSFVNVFIYHFPAGTSWRVILHFSQLYARRKFAQFDYGIEKNLEIYHSPEPPVYKLKKVTMPVALFVGKNDRLSPLADVALLKRQLPNVVDYKVPKWPLFNTLDNIWGRRMRVYLFPYIYRLLNQYNTV